MCGRYTLTVQYVHFGSGGWQSMTPSTHDLNGSGSVQTASYLGQANPAEYPQVRIHFQGPTDFYSDVANWGNLN